MEVPPSDETSGNYNKLHTLAGQKASSSLQQLDIQSVHVACIHKAGDVFCVVM